MKLPTLPYPDEEICNVGISVDAVGWYLTVTRDGARAVPVGRSYPNKEVVLQDIAIALRRRIRAVRRLMGRDVSSLVAD